jgi:hypothetical protein
MSASSEVKAQHEAWRLMNRVYYHLRQQGAPREAKVIVNNLAAELFEEMFKEAA